MSDKVQSIPRINEVTDTIHPADLSAAKVVSSLHSGKDIHKLQDDSVFVSPTAKDRDNVNETRSSTSHHVESNYIASQSPVERTTKRVNSRNSDAQSPLISLTNKPTNIPPVGQIINTGNIPISSPMKTLIVMAPSVMKGLNLKQVTTPGHGIQFAVSCSPCPITSPTSAVLVKNESRKHVIHATPPKLQLAQQLIDEHSHSTSAGFPDHQSAASPVSSPGYLQQDSVPSTPLIAEGDPFQQSEQIPVTCRKNRAILDRRKLGSGQRGKCIFFRNTWMTPSLFEIECGLSMSKDWKRSIRYAGCTVQKLINEAYLRPHSAVCTCAICSDDDSVTCPVRLFQPYKRRKRSSAAISPLNSPMPVKMQTSNLPDFEGKNPAANNSVFSPVPTSALNVQPDGHFNKSTSSDTESVIHSYVAESELMEHRLWWQLEEMSNNLVEQAQRLKTAIADAKTTSSNRRITLMQQLVSHFEKEKQEAISVLQESSMLATAHKTNSKVATETASHAPPASVIGNLYTEESLPKQRSNSSSLPMQKEKERIDRSGRNSCGDAHGHQYCNTCGNAAISECTGCRKATYCSTACQEKDWLSGHSETCQSSRDETGGKLNDSDEVLMINRTDDEDYVVVSTATMTTSQ